MKGSVVSTLNGSCNQLGTIQLFYSDEHAMTLGVRQITLKNSCGTTVTNYPFSTGPTSTPTTALNPQVGASEAQGGTDTSGRPMFPSLYITDLDLPPGSTNPLAGDWQYGGTGIPPTAVFGTWKGATKSINQINGTITVTPDADPPANHWDLGPDADPVPPGLQDENYGAEASWDINALGLISGHHYRVYFIVHDGDQNQSGGDCGQANWYFTLPGIAPPTPTASPTPTATATATATGTPPCPTATATATFTPTATATATFTPTATATATFTPTPTATATATFTPTPTPTATPATIIVTNKALGAKQVQITFQNNTAVAQVLTGLDMTWPQAMNGNLNNVKMGGVTIYNTATASPLHTTSLLGTPAQRTIAANGGSATLNFAFANTVDTNANDYTGSATFNPFGIVTDLP